MSQILFIGNFLSKYKGTISPSEQVARLMKEEGMQVRTASSFKNRYFRLADILWKSAFSPYQVMHVDVFSGNSFLFAEWASSLAKWRGKKVVLNLHGGKLPDMFVQSPKRFHQLFAIADKIVTPSTYLKEFFGAQGYHIVRLPNFIQLADFAFNTSQIDTLSLLWVRAFSEIYNPALAVETLSLLKQDFPGLKLTMIGPDMGKLEEIAAYIRDNGLEQQVDILGQKQNGEMAFYYQNHSIYLNTTRYESFGVALLEAAACGLPAVSTAVGEIPHLWEDEKDILLIEKPDAAIMANQVKRLLNDASLRRSLSTNARKKAEQYDWSIVRQSWHELLMSV